MIYTEITPNPNSVKFIITGQILLEQGTVDFDSCPTSEDSLLGHKLFQLPAVQRVFIGKDFITVTKSNEVRWEQLIPQVRKVIQELLDLNAPLVNSELARDSSNGNSENPLVQRIRDIIENQIRPAVAMDGGDVLFHSYENGVVYVTLRGSCSGCPSATLTLQMGIQNLLQHFIPEIKEVKAIYE